MSEPIPGEASLNENEYHPSADSAMAWLKTFIMENPSRWMMISEAVASTALSGNRLAELCHSTMNRLANGEPVSDRYLLGLAWFIRDNFERDNEETINSASSVQRPRKRKKNTPSNSK